jgi:uncharacterized protein YndB with AHSA1/START domain
MKTEAQTIEKSIDINAPKERVWDVLLNDKFTRIWYSEFSEGAYAETDWKVGSKALFLDKKQCGIVGKVIANKPYEVISIEYEGIVMDGVEDYESADAKQVKGALETYHLSEKNGVTRVSIECDMGPEWFETMSLSWDKALLKIKELSENEGMNRDKEETEIFTVNEDIRVFCVTASSFPEGVLEAYKKLHSFVPFSKDRRYFGISRPNEKGTIIYKAAAEEINEGEAEKLKCETMSIQRGKYVSLIIKDYIKDVQQIGKVFQQLLAYPDIDPEGYCIEWYLNDNDVNCMVKLK